MGGALVEGGDTVEEEEVPQMLLLLCVGSSDLAVSPPVGVVVDVIPDVAAR